MLFNSTSDNQLSRWIKSIINFDRISPLGLTVSLLEVFFFFSVLPPILKSYWPQSFIESYPKQVFTFVLTVAMHTLVNVVLHSVTCLVYKLNHPFFEQYKNTTAPWPWEADAEKWHEKLIKSLKVLAEQHFIVFPAAIGANIFLLKGMNYMTDIESFPSGFQIAKHIFFCILCEDFFLYWTHRILHTPFFYSRVHKIHHEYNEPVCLSSEYAHPFEHVFSSLLPAGAGLMILGNRVHMVTHILWMVVRLMKTVDVHCGYNFPWSPFQYVPFGTSSAFHDFHHTNNLGNYASFFTFWDWAMGTKTAFEEHPVQKQQQLEQSTQAKPISATSKLKSS